MKVGSKGDQGKVKGWRRAGDWGEGIRGPQNAGFERREANSKLDQTMVHSWEVRSILLVYG